MKRTILTSLALTVMLGLTGSVQANPMSKPGSSGKGNSNDHRHDSSRRGRDYSRWSSRYFDHRFGCYLYCCPNTESYYYWCAKDDCYYPTDHCPYGTYGFGSGCVCSSCPEVEPRHHPDYPSHSGWSKSSGGFKNTIHPIIYDPPSKHHNDNSHSMKWVSNGSYKHGSGSHHHK
jgi:hypothetical protein